MIVEDIIVIDDEGCEVWPTCTECPLSRCRFDDPRWFAAGINRAPRPAGGGSHRTRAPQPLGGSQAVPREEAHDPPETGTCPRQTR